MKGKGKRRDLSAYLDYCASRVDPADAGLVAWMATHGRFPEDDLRNDGEKPKKITSLGVSFFERVGFLVGYWMKLG